jgi:hypothetical protein
MAQTRLYDTSLRIVGFEQHIAAILNRRLVSSLRVELDEVSHTTPIGQANLSALAGEVQAMLDEVERAPVEQLAEQHMWADGGLRVVWHARRREQVEEAEPVVDS